MMRTTNRPVAQLTALAEPTLALGLLLATVLLLHQSLPTAGQSFSDLLLVFRVGAACLGRPDLAC